MADAEVATVMARRADAIVIFVRDIQAPRFVCRPYIR
jgi:hypothetical protein